ncbi:MAG: hypothetical protein H8D49_00220 [Dehalococcoidia bacterium]|nr:hypothetical protein [Dehalococcoidia bacterium]MBL7165219.1 hypothetical protein [Dehalococcoidales bacterium]
MRQGCISLGKVQCDGCKNTIPYAERYLLVDEEDGVEVEGGKKACYCVNCSLGKGYARYREEKNERVLTFFPVEPEPQDITPQDLVQ